MTLIRQERRKTRGIKITDLKNMVSGKHAGRPDRERAESANQPMDPKTKKLLAKTKSRKYYCVS